MADESVLFVDDVERTDAALDRFVGMLAQGASLDCALVRGLGLQKTRTPFRAGSVMDIVAGNACAPSW